MYTILTKDSLFYNKYKYKAKLQKIVGAWFLHNVKSFKDYENKLSDEWWEKLLNTDLTDPNRTNLKNLIKFKETNNKEVTIRVEGAYVSVFSNNLDILKELEQNFVVKQYFEVNCIPKVKFFHKPPKFKYRTYFRINYNVDNASLYDYIMRQKALGLVDYNKYIDKPLKKFYRMPMLFVDYNDEKIITFLSLLHSEKVWKTYKLEWIGDKDKYI